MRRGLLVAFEAALMAASWWMMQSEEEQRLLRAGFWQFVQQGSSAVAVRAGKLALGAEQRYYAEVRS